MQYFTFLLLYAAQGIPTNIFVVFCSLMRNSELRLFARFNYKTLLQKCLTKAIPIIGTDYVFRSGFCVVTLPPKLTSRMQVL